MTAKMMLITENTIDATPHERADPGSVADLLRPHTVDIRQPTNV